MRLLHPREMISLIDFSGLRISHVMDMVLSISYEKFCCPNDWLVWKAGEKFEVFQTVWLPLKILIIKKNLIWAVVWRLDLKSLL